MTDADPNKRVRKTVDIDARTYRDLSAWQNRAALNLGVPRVTTQDALRALIEVCLENPAVSKETTGKLRGWYEEAAQ